MDDWIISFIIPSHVNKLEVVDRFWEAGEERGNIGITKFRVYAFYPVEGFQGRNLGIL